MKKYLRIILVCLSVGISSLSEDLRDNVASLIEKGDEIHKKHVQRRIGEENVHTYPLLRRFGSNILKKNRHKPVPWSFRRREKYHTSESNEHVSSSSSSLEMPKWKDEWREIWLEHKYTAMNSTPPKGDHVNMVAARPWGVPCGDPNQHDMPWGSCMLAIECEPEYRIYRGDFSCGRTRFVCCALQLNTYDMYQGFDASFADSELKTDSDEKKNRDRSSSAAGNKKRKRERQKRRRERLKRKRKIKKTIVKIVRMIRRILSRAYRNGTKARKRKTKQLKKFIKMLKKKYIAERNAVAEIHEIELIKIDKKLMDKLIQIKDLNDNFMSNSTFRDIVVNGTINKRQARMLMEAYPELTPELLSLRRTGGDLEAQRDYLDYDIEYGLVYD